MMNLLPLDLGSGNVTTVTMQRLCQRVRLHNSPHERR